MVTDEDDYFGGDYLQDILETALLEVGGSVLLDCAAGDARWVAEHDHPWDGVGQEPPERVSAYCAVLQQWLDASVQAVLRRRGSGAAE